MRMKDRGAEWNSIFSGLALFAILLSAALCVAQQKTVVLDGASSGKTFDGIGAVSAGASSRLLIDYPEPQRSQILDYLFKPGYGAALQHLKVEVGADVNSTDGAEPSHMRTRNDHNYTRGYEWWLMEEARKRNPNIILDILPWGAPGWIGGGKFYSQDMANYMADFIQGAEQQHHLNIGYAGIWNERVYSAEYVKILHKTLSQKQPQVKIVCCDEYIGEGAGQWAISDAIKNDPELDASVAVIGVHYPLKNGKITTTESARLSDKPLWSSEDQPNSGGGPYLSREWDVGGRILAHLYNKNYLEGAITKTEIWSPITSYYDILAAPNSGLMYANTPWSGHYDVQGTIWATAHTTQFAQPGWRYLDSSSGYLPGKGTYVALKSPSGRDWSVVLETIGATRPQPVSFRITGGLGGETVHIWETNDTKTFEHVADVPVRGNGFEYAFDPNSLYSLTTTLGQSKGVAKAPAEGGFPMPYVDDFNQRIIGRAPLYLADQDGAFEVRRCESRRGKCLEQVITTKPIPWSPLPDPFTMAGDAAWTDYEVASDFHLTIGTATLMGRIDSANVFTDKHARWPSAYVLSIHSDGRWDLDSYAFKKPPVKLASGKVDLPDRPWHRFALGMMGNRITATLDGKYLANVQDRSHTHGMFGVGTEWNRAQFSRLSVTEAK